MTPQITRKRVALLAVAALLPAAAPLQARGSNLEGRKIQVPVSDGAKLAADVYRPESDGPIPVVLLRTRNPNTGESPESATEFKQGGTRLI